MNNQVSDIPSQLIEALLVSKKVTVLTGSGISAESGIPTFREAQTGLWARYDPMELATPEAFSRNPKLVWDWYTWRRELIGSAKPNQGHTSLAELEAFVPDFVLITQNIDGFHQLAGSQNVIELHGNIHRTKCFQENLPIETWESNDDRPPRCFHCGGLLRPDVVWFGESLKRPDINASLEAAHDCEIFFSIGTSALVQPAASLAYEAKESGALVVEINIDETPLTSFADFYLQGFSGTILPALMQATKGSTQSARKQD